MCISLRLFIMFMVLAECHVYSSCFCVGFFLLCVQQKHPFSFVHPCLRSSFVTTTKRCVRQPMVSMFNVVSTTLFLRLPLETSRSIKHMAQNELMVNCMMAHHSRSRRHTYLNTHHRQSRSQHNIKKMVGRSWDTPREKRHDMTAHTHTPNNTHSCEMQRKQFSTVGACLAHYILECGITGIHRQKFTTVNFRVNLFNAYLKTKVVSHNRKLLNSFAVASINTALKE